MIGAWLYNLLINGILGGGNANNFGIFTPKKWGNDLNIDVFFRDVSDFGSPG